MDDKYNKMTKSFVVPALSVSLGRQSNGCYFRLVVSNGFNLLVGYWGPKEFQIVSEWFNQPGWFQGASQRTGGFGDLSSHQAISDAVVVAAFPVNFRSGLKAMNIKDCGLCPSTNQKIGSVEGVLNIS